MERRRPRLDPMLAEHVSERLALVLADRQPRRAQVEDDPTTLTPTGPPPDPAPGAGAHQSPVEARHGPDYRQPSELPGPTDLGPAEDLDSLGGLPPVRRFTRRHLSVLGALVVLGLLLAGWSLLRARPVALATPGAVAVSATTPGPAKSGVTPAPSGSGTAATKPSIVVHVLGAVRRPGLVTLPEPARVQDAIDAAGGLKSGADPGELNLAQPLTDGQQVVIAKLSDPPSEVRDAGPGGGSGGGGGGGGSGSGGGSAVLDLNRATSAQLEALPGVGPVTAGKILAWRQEHGRFSRAEELQEVDGIGPKIYAQIAPHIRV